MVSGSRLEAAVARGVALAVLRRPSLWATALRQAARLAPRGWWRRRPFLPVPDGRYLALRMETMYGDASRQPGVDDVVAYLEWCRVWRRQGP